MMNPRSSFLAENVRFARHFRFLTSVDGDDSTALETGSIDVRDYMQPTMVFIVRTGNANVASTPVLQHSDNNTDWTDIDDDEYASGAAPGTITNVTGVTMATYVGLKRYVRARVVNVNSDSSSQELAVMAVCMAWRRIAGL